MLIGNLVSVDLIRSNMSSLLLFLLQVKSAGIQRPRDNASMWHGFGNIHGFGLVGRSYRLMWAYSETPTKPAVEVLCMQPIYYYYVRKAEP